MSYKSMTLVRPEDAIYVVSDAQYSIARSDEYGLEVNITKDQFLVAVKDELAVSPYDEAKHNGLRNPYNGRIIISLSDYEKYIREYTFHRLCEENTIKAYNSRVAAELRRATVRHEEAQARTRRKFRILTFFLCMALLSTLIYIFFFYQYGYRN